MEPERFLLYSCTDHATAAEQFVKEGLGPGLWTQFPPEIRQMMAEHAPTYLDEANDPDQLTFDLEWIRGFPHPALLTHGEKSPPVFPQVVTKLADAMPSVMEYTFAGVGHAAHMEHPDAYAKAIAAFIRRHTK